MMAVPRAKMLDVAIPLLSLAEQLLLEISVRKKLNCCSRGVRSAGKKIRNDHPTIAMCASILAAGIEIAKIFAAFLTSGIAMQFVQHIVEDMPIKDDFIIRGRLNVHSSVFAPGF